MVLGSEQFGGVWKPHLLTPDTHLTFLLNSRSICEVVKRSWLNALDCFMSWHNSSSSSSTSYAHMEKKIYSLLKRCLLLVFLTSKGGKGIKKWTIKGNDEVSMVRKREEIPNSLFTVGLISVQTANWWQIALQQFPYTHTHVIRYTHICSFPAVFNTARLAGEERPTPDRVNPKRKNTHTQTQRLVIFSIISYSTGQLCSLGRLFLGGRSWLDDLQNLSCCFCLTQATCKRRFFVRPGCDEDGTGLATRPNIWKQFNSYY